MITKKLVQIFSSVSGFQIPSPQIPLLNFFSNTSFSYTPPHWYIRAFYALCTGGLAGRRPQRLDQLRFQTTNHFAGAPRVWSARSVWFPSVNNLDQWSLWVVRVPNACLPFADCFASKTLPAPSLRRFELPVCCPARQCTAHRRVISYSAGTLIFLWKTLRYWGRPIPARGAQAVFVVIYLPLLRTPARVRGVYNGE